MSKAIKVLNDLTINKIAAGEVVEGPYSVVKELIENAVDADATAIVIEIKEGGQKYIRISDNGIGIYEEDVETAFMRHTTSKIVTAEDLNHVKTLGFRGEALASIAAVSQVQITTKPKDQMYGISLEISGGNIISKQEVGTPDGTTIIVRNLFFNVPARQKFMKSPQAEAAKIGEIVTRLALSRPNISFKYINNNNIMFTTPGNNNLEQTIISIMDKELVKNLLPVKASNEYIKIHGYISQPTFARGNRNFEIFFINGRYVKSALISKAIEDAYKEKIIIHKYPICILNIDIDLSLIDVNVHPTKAEVKIQNEKLLYQLLYDAVISILSHSSKIPSIKLGNSLSDMKIRYNNTYDYRELKENKSIYNTYNNTVSKTLQVSLDKYNNDEDTNKEKNIKEFIEIERNNLKRNNLINKNYKEEYYEDLVITQENFLTNILKDYKIIGQLFNTYIIVEKDLSMFLIDQHAAHERVVYNKMLKEHKENNIASQRLLEPKVLELSNEDYSFIIQYLDRFIKLGFQIESFGFNTLIIREVPLIMGIPRNYDFLLDVIDDLKNKNFDETYFDQVIIRKSCREAIKASDKLTVEEMHQLIRELYTIQPPLTCPHGRPIILSLTKYEIEKSFKRIQ